MGVVDEADSFSDDATAPSVNPTARDEDVNKGTVAAGTEGIWVSKVSDSLTSFLAFL